ncbi:MAG: carbohydrate ABC transporter permease [Proteobacteria bacterium]|nr:carbohydrate ABC transporter permease [Pseudomonadota bacterium]
MTKPGTNAVSFRRTKTLNTIVLSLFLIYSLLPIYYLGISTTKSSRDLYSTFGLWFSSEFHLIANLQELFAYDGGRYLRWMTNSIFYSVASASGATLIASMAGYGLSRYEFAGRRLLVAIVIGAVLIPQTIMVIPIFLMLAKIGLLDSAWGFILPSTVYAPGVYLMRGYIDQSVPMELIEAARMDGANELTIFARIALHLMSPGLVTVFLLSFVHCWNSYFLPLVIFTSADKFPINVGLPIWYQYATQGSGGSSGQGLFTLILTGAFVGVLPIVAAFVYLQRYWQGGLASGAIK